MTPCSKCAEPEYLKVRFPRFSFGLSRCKSSFGSSASGITTYIVVSNKVSSFIITGVKKKTCVFSVSFLIKPTLKHQKCLKRSQALKQCGQHDFVTVEGFCWRWLTVYPMQCRWNTGVAHDRGYYRHMDKGGRFLKKLWCCVGGRA